MSRWRRLEEIRWTLGWHETVHLAARDFGHEETFWMLMDRSPVELLHRLACEMREAVLCREILAAHPIPGKGFSAARRHGNPARR